jgi:DNA-binding transcriptional MerR regulator
MNELIKISEVSERYAITTRSLRYYEDMGLINSTRNDDYAYRLYDESAVKRLEQILILRRLNISIKDIKRVFDTPGSDVVLEVLDKKVTDIDDEVALLHELKEIVLEFIRQIKNTDFSNDSNVKLLYEKARDIEAQLNNVDYNGNPSTVNRLLEVTEKLSMTPEIVKKRSRFYLIFDLGSIQNVLEACELYSNAFGAEKFPEDRGEWQGKEWIGVSLKIFDLDIWVQSNDKPLGGQNCCAIQFASEEELRYAYNLLIQEGTEYSIVLDGWAPLIALVRDKFGVHWFFYFE